MQAARWIMDSSLFAGRNLEELQEIYERLEKHNPDEFLTYTYIDKCARIDDHGNLLPNKKCPHSWYVDNKRLAIILKHLYSRGYTLKKYRSIILRELAQKPYLPGIHLSDVIGASHYCNKKDLNLSWKLAKDF